MGARTSGAGTTSSAEVRIMPFIQIVEYETTHPDEVDAQMRAAVRSEPGASHITHLSQTRDHENPNHYLTLVEFPNYDVAMENSARPETTAMAKQLEQLCTSGPRYHNLDVLMSTP
jgi:hypothetical protein